MYVPLHNPVLVVAACIQAAATRVNDPPGELSSGWRDQYRQPAMYQDPTTGERTSAVQFVERRFKAQVETNREALKRMTLAGDMPDFEIALVGHARDLKTRGLMCSINYLPKVRVGDRVRRLVNPRRPSQVIESWDEGTGRELWIDEVRAASWGFTGLRDLFVFFCIKKEQPG